MQIVIDMQGAQSSSHKRGIGRVTRSFVRAILQNKGNHDVILVLNGLFPDTIETIRAAFDGLIPQENILVWHTLGPVQERQSGNGWRRKVAECIREAFIYGLNPSILYIPSFFEGFVDDAVLSIDYFSPHILTVVTLHDLIPLIQPESYFQKNSRYSRFYHNKLSHFQRANYWFSDSKSAAKEGIQYLGFHSDSITTINLACDTVFKKFGTPNLESENILSKLEISKPFILYSGGCDERKNLVRLIKAFSYLSESLKLKYQLVIVGNFPTEKLAELKKLARHLGILDCMVFTGFVSDPDLATLYNLCDLFVFPSLHEGFGLPALEAMSCGAPVIASNTSSLPEIIVFKEALFDPLDEVAISQKMTRALEDFEFKEALIQNGLVQSKRFSWDESAKQAISIFEKLHASNGDVQQQISPDELLNNLIHKISEIIPKNISKHDLLHLAQALSFIPVEHRQKQFFIDISELAQRDARTGVQRVTRSILNEFLKTPPKGYVVRPVYATLESKGYLHARKYLANIQGETANEPDDVIDYQPGDIFLGLDLQHHTTRVQSQFLRSMRTNGVGVKFVIYDLLPVFFPHYWPKEHMVDKVHEEWLRVIAQNDGAICISKAVADELKDWMISKNCYDICGNIRLRPFKIDWFHLGGDLQNSVPTTGLPENAKPLVETFSSRKTFLVVGTIEPRKGQLQTLNAFELLWNDGVDVNLIFVGKQGWDVETLVKRIRNHPEFNHRLFWLEGISDEFLETVYQASSCLISPSEGEGFGLPLIESAQHQLPIIARDLPVFREVAGDFAFYFNGLAPNDLSVAVRAWLKLDLAGKAPSSKGMPYLTWEQSKEQLLSALGI